MRTKLIAAAMVSCLAASPALADDRAAGEQSFKTQCSACHSLKEKGPGIGPTLAGIVGRKAGSVSGFSYSAAMKQSGITWTAPKLKAYIAAPQTVVKGNRMPFAGIKDKTVAANIVAFLAGPH